jgi:deoxycytidine triphosphate deaminase
MSIITKKDIIERVQSGSLAFKPNLDKFQLQEHSVDLRLGFTFMIPKMWHMTAKGRESLDITHFDKRNHEYFEVVELEQGQYFELLPQEYILVSTLEGIKMPTDLMGVLYPRSSTNRKGLSLDLTGIIDAGYEGQLILPILLPSKTFPSFITITPIPTFITFSSFDFDIIYIKYF